MTDVPQKNSAVSRPRGQELPVGRESQSVDGTLKTELRWISEERLKVHAGWTQDALLLRLPPPAVFQLLPAWIRRGGAGGGSALILGNRLKLPSKGNILWREVCSSPSTLIEKTKLTLLLQKTEPC